MADLGAAEIAVDAPPSTAPPAKKAPTKNPILDGPILSTAGSGGRYVGPGGADLVSFAGKDWLLFHSWDDATVYRGLHAVPVTWRGGVPVPAT